MPELPPTIRTRSGFGSVSKEFIEPPLRAAGRRKRAAALEAFSRDTAEMGNGKIRMF
jgi:hypothetical protein